MNPNEDGTYTSPGEDYKGFTPSENQRYLSLTSADGTTAYKFGENRDGSPDHFSLQTGMVKDASMDIVGLFIPGRLGVKGLLAGASALWAKHAARKAAQETAESAAERLVKLAGKTRAEARQVLQRNGFESKGTTGGGYEKWYHSDGSRVQIRPNGEIVRSAPNVKPEGGGRGYRPESVQTESQQDLTVPEKKSVVKTLPANHQRLIQQLVNCTMSEISIEPSGCWLRFHFTSTIDKPSLILELFNPVLFKLSRTLDDEGHYVVGEASLTPIEDGGKEVFGSLGYGFRADEGALFVYPSRFLFHFHLEGDVCVDAVCESYEILEEIKA